MRYSESKIRNGLILLIRIWLGYRLIGASYTSVIDIIFHPEERAFYEKWFGKELHYPWPLAMAFLAKGIELAGGFLIFLGLFTRPASVLVAFTMMMATITANLGENWIIDGGFTVSYFLFALILIAEGSGKYSLDFLISRKKEFRVKKEQEINSLDYARNHPLR